MGRNLGPLNIKDSYEGLVQISGSQLTNGSGSLIPSLEVTSSYATTAISASFATTAISASHSLNSNTAISASYAVTASYALNGGAGGTPSLQQVTGVGNSTSQGIVLGGVGSTASLTFNPAYANTFGNINQRNGALVLSVTGSGSGGSTSPDILFEVNARTVVDIDENKINFEADVDASSYNITASNFVGNFTGTAAIANEVYINIDTTDTEKPITLVDNTAVGVQALRVDQGGGFTYNTSQDRLTVQALSTNAQVKGNVVVLTSVASATTMDCSLGNFFTLAMPSGGFTNLTATNITAGQTISVKITQNATPSSLSFAPAIVFDNASPFVVSTGAGFVDVITFISFDGTSLQAVGLKNFQ